MKAAFSVAPITSDQRVGEIQALRTGPLYTVFHKDKVTLRPHPKFLPKVVSEFHVNESTDLPVSFPKSHSTSEDAKLHTLDVVRGLP